MSKTVIGIIAIAVLMMMFPFVMSATHDLQTDDITDTFADVTTGVGITEADVVLTYDTFHSTIADVGTIVSSLGTDVPVAGTYVAATKTLTITGLTESETRDFTAVPYENDALEDYTGMGALVAFTPLLIWLSILAAVLGGMYVSFKGRQS